MNSEDAIKAYKAHITTKNMAERSQIRLVDKSLRYKAMIGVLERGEGTPLKTFRFFFVRQLRVHALPKMLQKG